LPTRILLVEDDTHVATFIQKGLQAEHCNVDLVSDGLEAQGLAVENDYDLVILDVGLPGADGFQVLRFIRVNKPLVPVLILSGHSKIEDRVRGLDSGADDYLVKPFSFTELSARVRALLRRRERPENSMLRVQDLEVDLVSRVVTRAGKRIELSSREYSLLIYLMKNAGRCVTRAMIMEHVWALAFDTSTNVVDVYINYLRSKVDRGFQYKLIRTMRGIGYQIERRKVEDEQELSEAAE
jgi:two-component system, OmpR family, copper resistance phosphate regulon response regulator CusR